jgi:hypothetical protein
MESTISAPNYLENIMALRQSINMSLGSELERQPLHNRNIQC